MFETLETFNTELSADSVEWCPITNFEDIFVCGTYQLETQEARIGRIYLFQITKEEKKTSLKLIQQLDGAGVLDMKWARTKCSGKILLGVARFTGHLQIYELIGESEATSLKMLAEISVKSKEGKTPIALSLDWAIDEGKVRLTVSDSHGFITLFELSDDASGLEEIASWYGHEFEAWIAAFDGWDRNVVYTGGDDGKFLKFDIRTDTSSEIKPVLTNQSHEAGVTSIISSWKNEHYLVTGSYDENLRTWDTRNLRRPIRDLYLGGGIWRIKWDPYEAKYLLAAGMYGGFFIIQAEDPNATEIIAKYDEHESIAYGCDWSYLNRNEDKKRELLKSGENKVFVGTCSFYDHCLKLSAVELDDFHVS